MLIIIIKYNFYDILELVKTTGLSVNIMLKKQPMKKIFLGVMTPLAATLLVACGTVQPGYVCTFPDVAGAPAPAWVCDPGSVSGGNLAAVGIGSSRSIALRPSQCLGAARVQMAQTLEVSVKSMFQQFIESTGEADQETLDQMSKSVTEQLTDAKLQGTSLKKQASSPKGVLYCLVAMETSKLNLITQAMNNSAAKTSMGNKRALWQKFQAKLSLDEMTKKLEADK